MKNSKKFVLAFASFICILFSLPARSQQSLIKVNGWNAYVHLPADYSTTTKTFPTIIFFPGIGEIGTNASLVISNGPGAYITQGWNGNIAVGSSTVEFIVISLQPPAAYPQEVTMNTEIQGLKSLYRIDTKHLFLTGLSEGGWCCTTFVTGDPLGGPYTYASQVAAIVNVEGVKPDDNSPYPTLFQNFAKAGGRIANFEQAQDGRDMPTYTNTMNSTVANSAIYTQTDFGSGGHCCWASFYGGQGTTPSNFTLDGASQNIYQWLAKIALNGQAVQVTNTPPVANAGTDQTITLPTNAVTLTGTATDAGGTISTYAWSKVSGPTSGTIASPSAAKTVINNLVQGTYVFALKVTDNNSATATDNITVTVNAAKQPPVANAGTDQTITLPTNAVTLTGTATDAGGTVSSYAWSKVSGPANGTIASPSSAKTAINSLTQGTYVFALKVTDNNSATATDNITVTVNAATIKTPVVNAGADQTITLPTNTVTLSGSATDANASISKYAWTKTSGPSGPTIVSASSAKTVIKNLVQGTFIFSLKATDSKGATATDNITVTVKAAAANQPPVANAGADQTITLPTNSVTLTGTGTDADGTISKYAWAKVSGPSSSTIASASAAKTVINSLTQGTYTFSLTVTDNSGASATDNVNVIVNAAAVTNQPPVANAGTDQTITLPTNSVTLTGTGTDADGTISKYAWAKVSGPSSATIVSASAAKTVINSLTQGTYIFSLTVTDNSGATATDNVNVIVNAASSTSGTSGIGASSCNASAPVTYTQAQTDAGDIYKVTPDPAWQGGDTIKIPAGTYSGVIEFDHLHGDPCRPIVIINTGGLVSTTTIRLKSDCEYVRLTGTGTPGLTYGFKTTAGPVAVDYGHHLEFDHIEVTNPVNGVGMWMKCDPDVTNPVTLYVPGSSTNYVLNKFYIHHCWIHDTNGEGMYIGHTAPDGGDGQTGTNADGSNILPLRMDSVEIAYNIVERTAWDGIQLSNAKDGAKIHDNIVRNYGTINMGNQQCGIILGGNTRGDVYNNTVKSGTGNGIELFGYGTINCYNNFVDSTGYDGTAAGQESVYANDIPIVSEPEAKQQIVMYGDTINHPMTRAAIRVGAYNNNSLASNIHDNKFCIPSATSTWQSTYIILNASGSSNVNNVLACLTGGATTLLSRPADNTAADVTTANSLAVKIFPNPVISIFTLEVDASTVGQNAVILITDVQGKTLYQQELLVSQPTTYLKIDMSKFMDGIYFLTTKTTTKNITEKVIKASR